MLKSIISLAIVVTMSAFLPGNTQTGGEGISWSTSATATLPSNTDPQIIDFNEPHLSWLPSATPRNQLLIFLPGTNGTPRENFPFAQTAQALGYHVISLMYPDTVAAQQACPNSNDPDAYMKFRLAIIQGGDFGDIHIARPSSIENRLAKLIAYLAHTQPRHGWEQYQDPAGQIVWNKIAVSGHSQGGGHAYVIGKIHEVSRVIEFGSPKDYSFFFHGPARGFDSNTKTPLTRFFAFNHLEDAVGGCNHAMQMEILKQMRLTELGMVQAESPNIDFRHAHLIFTDLPIPNMQSRKQFHGSVINGSLPVCRPVWTYMLTEPVS